MTSKDNQSYLNAHVRDLETGGDTLLNIGENSPTVLAAVSPNEEVFVYIRQYANTYATGYVKIGSEEYPLTPDDKKVHISYNPIFIDNHTVYFTTDYEVKYAYLAKYGLLSKQFSEVLKINEESIEDLKWNKHMQKFYLVTEKGVTDFLYTYDLATKNLEKIKTPVDVINKIEVTERGTVYLLGLSAKLPTNIFELTDEWKQLTNNGVLGVNEVEMVEPDVVSYKSFDNLEIEALLFKALPENDNGHTIFWPHGGPQAAERKTFRSMFQSFLNRGYTIFAPNFRGSTGYGSEFVKLVEHDWGHGPRLDCIEGIDWLIDQVITDKERLFLVGDSYGGYMALLLHGRHPEYFKAVVDILDHLTYLHLLTLCQRTGNRLCNVG